jgi:hypothetical protein
MRYLLLKARSPVVTLVLMVACTVTVCVWAFWQPSALMGLLAVPVLPFTSLRLGESALGKIRPTRPAANEPHGNVGPDDPTRQPLSFDKCSAGLHS